MSTPMKRQKLSGAQSGKKRQQTELSMEKQTGWLSNYLKKTKTTQLLMLLPSLTSHQLAIQKPQRSMLLVKMLRKMKWK